MSGLFSDTADLASPDLKRLIVRLALPAVVGLSANAAHHTANALFVGAISLEALAAVTAALPIVMLVAAIGEGLGVGAAATIGRLLGEGRPGRASVTASTVIAVAFPVGLALTAALLVARRPLLELFGAPAGAMPMAETYLVVVACGATLILLQVICDFVAISEGNTRFSMWTLIGGFGLNVALDPILIFWLDMGVGGAALATILSQIVVLCVYGFYFRRRLGVLRVAARNVRIGGAILKPVVAVGLPAAAASALTGAAFAVLYRSAAEHGGEAGLAAVGIALRVLTLGTLPVIGFALGAQAALGFAWGAGDRPRVVAATRFMLAASTGFATLYGLAVVAFARPIASLFTSDAATIELAAVALVAAHVAFPLIGARYVLLVLLQAIGRTRQAGLLALAPNGYLLAPPLGVLPMRFGFSGVVWSLAVAAILTGALAAMFGAQIRRELRDPHAPRRPFSTRQIEPTRQGAST
ncbi:MATE family efflux transporter [Methylopila sp. M107]|uniref:MATE family efflux transporter n=1 Tax=Methylopila sp. M107 TaxID=1101190 RepID=UPI00039D57C0|nr:MATE family efflux transporter [Methylopila sp. M107]